MLFLLEVYRVKNYYFLNFFLSSYFHIQESNHKTKLRATFILYSVQVPIKKVISCNTKYMWGAKTGFNKFPPSVCVCVCVGVGVGVGVCVCVCVWVWVWVWVCGCVLLSCFLPLSCSFLHYCLCLPKSL